MSGGGCQPCGGGRWACPAIGKALPCRRTTAVGSNPVVTMFPEDIRCFACDAPKPVDPKQVKIDAFLKLNPEMADLFPKGKSKASRNADAKGTGGKDKGKGKGGKGDAQCKGKSKGKYCKGNAAGKDDSQKGNGKGGKGGKHVGGPNAPLKNAEILDAYDYKNAGGDSKNADEEHCNLRSLRTNPQQPQTRVGALVQQ